MTKEEMELIEAYRNGGLWNGKLLALIDRLALIKEKAARVLAAHGGPVDEAIEAYDALRAALAANEEGRG